MKSEGLTQFIRFGVVGVFNTAVDWIAFFLLFHYVFGQSETLSKALAFLVAMLNSYLWNTIWTFKKEYGKAVGKSGDIKIKSAIFAKFMGVSLVGWGVNVGVFSWSLKNIAYELLNNKELLSLILASGAAILWNFFANKTFTYKK
jgi:putative flippase GtrA